MGKAHVTGGDAADVRCAGAVELMADRSFVADDVDGRRARARRLRPVARLDAAPAEPVRERHLRGGRRRHRRAVDPARAPQGLPPARTRSNPNSTGSTRCGATATSPCPPCCPPATVGASSPSTTAARRATSCTSRWWPGAEPDEKTLTVADFHTLGRITAALHDHSRAWARPPGFGRFAWDWEHSLGDHPRWGRWQDAAGVGEPERTMLEPRQRTAAATPGRVRHRTRTCSAWSTPTCGWPTCWSTATVRPRSPSSTSTTADSVGTSTISAPRCRSSRTTRPYPNGRTPGRRATAPGGRCPPPTRRCCRRSCCCADCCCWPGWVRTATPGNRRRCRSPTPTGSCALAERYLSSDGLRLALATRVPPPKGEPTCSTHCRAARPSSPAEARASAGASPRRSPLRASTSSSRAATRATSTPPSLPWPTSPAR